MSLVMGAIGLLVVSGLMALIINRNAKLSLAIAAWGVIAAAVVGSIPTGVTLFSGSTSFVSFPWQIPFGSLSLRLDSLSAFFLLCIFPISAVCAWYGMEYLKSLSSRGNVGVAAFFFNLLVASMVLVVTAVNVVFFLIAWEVMALTSFFLVTFDHGETRSRQAGMIYLIATHVGTAFLLAFFLLLGKGSNMDFVRPALLTPGLASLLFVLALVGFGTKAGIVPFHVWLPEAHPSAPSHVSALMSALMIKTGIYGLLRTISILGTPPSWWGGLLVGMGVFSGLFGIIFALAQNDMKRFLAYSSIENIGIITTAMGVGLLGMSYGVPILMIGGFAAALLHVFNHAVFKSLLFLGAGAVVHSTNTRNMDLMGGLWKRMPTTAKTFLIGSVALSGLPPLNGFISEFVLYWCVLIGIAAKTPGAVMLLVVLLGLALIGGLAAAGLTKVFGSIFLGEGRSESCQHAHEPGFKMRTALVLLSAGCVATTIALPFLFIRILEPVISQIIQAPMYLIGQTLGPLQKIFLGMVGLSALLIFVFVLIARFRGRALAGHQTERVLTWDCGYAQPTSRMEYTSSSFTQPMVLFFSGILRPLIRKGSMEKLFPDSTKWAMNVPDILSRGLYRRSYEWIERNFSQWRWIQHGRAHFYILYILLTLVVLLIWKMR